MITSYYSSELKTEIKNCIDYVAFTFDSRQLKSTDNISSFNEFYRVVPTITINPNNILVEVLIPITIDHLLTDVTSKASDKEFVLSSVSGLTIGDSIVFNYDSSTNIKDKVVNIVGNSVTLEKGNSVVTTGSKVSQEITFIHLVKGGSNTPNTGDSIYILPFNKIKFKATETKFSLSIIS